MKLSPSLQPLLLELATTARIKETGVPQGVSAEAQELIDATNALTGLRDAAAAAQLAVDDMELEILHIQEDERKLKRREADSRAQLQATSDPELRKDLEKDLVSTRSRLSFLTSEMQEAHNEVHALRQARDLAQQRIREAEAALEQAKQAVADLPQDTSEADRDARIAQLREALPAEVVAEFDAQVAENGVGAAFFNGRSCGGCFIMLPPAELGQIRQTPQEQLPQCSNCGSYLIRTK